MKLRVALVPRQVGLALILIAGLAAGFGRASLVRADPDDAGRRGSGRDLLQLEAPRLPAVAPALVRFAGPAQSTVVMREDFESSFPSQGWTVFDNDGATAGEYFWSNRCTGAGSARSAWAVGGGASGRQIGSCNVSYPANVDSWMAYGPLDFSSVSSAALDFKFWLNSECVGSQCSQKSDRLWALVSTDGQSFDGPWWAGDWYDDPTAVNGWISKTVDLSALAGEPRVYVAFVFQSDASTQYSGGAFVDDVALRVDLDACEPTASIRTLSTDRSCYAPGAQIGVFVDVTTASPGQQVRVEAQLAQADVIWASGEATFSAPGQRVIPITVPADLFPDRYTVRAMMWDAVDDCFQGYSEITVTIDPACGTATGAPPSPGTPKPPPCPNAGPVDVVFVMDTSGSMDDEFQALCGQVASVVGELQAMGITANYRILGITETRDCATGTVGGLLPGGRVDDSEDWAPAVADLSERYAWRAGHTRLIIPMSDEGPQNGSPTNDPGDDRDAINVAIALAKANQVVVSPVLGSGHEAEPAIAALAQALAAATGGRVFQSNDPAADLADGIADLIGAAACTPVVCCVEPICVNTANETVRIRGSTFLSGASVRIGGLAARDVVRVSDGEITARPAAGLGFGSWDVTVVNPPGGWSHTLPAALQLGGCVGTPTPTPSWTPWPSNTPGPSATLRPTPTPSFTPPPTQNPLQPPCPNAGPVDVVFVMDTSGSMDDEFEALCGQVSDIVARLSGMSVGLRYRIYGITEPRVCATEHVAGLLPGGQVNQQEDWAPAVVDLASRYGWLAGHARLIIPISDEGPEDGDPVNDPGDDRDAINAAIAAARAGHVIVSPVLGTGYGVAVEALAQSLAQGTGGRVFKTSDPAKDLADGIAQLIGAAACTPSISSVEPPCIETAAETIRIKGATFLPGVMVEIGGRPAQGVIRVSDAEIACRVDPALGQGVFDVKVINPPGGWSHTAARALQVGNCGASQCPPTRPEVEPSCISPNYVRNPGFEKLGQSWGQSSSSGRQLVSSDMARSGFYSARFEASPHQPGDERLFQMVNFPPDVTASSFWVEDVARAHSVIGDPPPVSGLDRFRAMLVDPASGRELVRLWEFDPVPECDIDPPFYNLTPAELDRVRGRQVALVFQLRKVASDAWSVIVLIDNVHLTACAPSPPCRVEGNKVAQPRVVAPAGEVTVLIDLSGIEGACLSQRPPADVVLVLDRSGSMQDQGKIDAAKAAARAFVDRVDLSRDQLALVSFADAALLDQGLTRQAGLVRAAIDRQAASGNTDLIGGLEVARAELLGSRHLAGNQPVVVLLSDGQPTTGDPRGAAQALKSDGARIFTVGLGTDVDPDLMRALASSPSDYFFAPDASQLDAIYQQIAGAIGGMPATNLRLVDRLSSYVELVPGSFTGSPPPTVSRDGRTLTWEIPRLGFETRILSYRVRMTRVPGTWPTNDSATVSYTNSRGQPATFSLPVPQVAVVAPPEPGTTEAEPKPELICRDHDRDDGSLPSNRLVEAWWDSPDIWVRNAPDGIEAMQNPIAGQANQVYVRVRNIGNVAVETIQVWVYDAVGATNLRWPDDWMPSIGSATIARLEAGSSAVVSVPWVPLGEGHFCFLVRIEALADPIKLDGWVPFDNNICQRNVQIIAAPGAPGSGSSTTGIGVGNRNRGSGYGGLRVGSGNLPPGARVVIELDPVLYDRWQGAGGRVIGGQLLPGEKAIELEVTPGQGGEAGSASAELERLPFEGEEQRGLKARIELPGSGPPLAALAQASEWPTLHISQLIDGQVVGGNVLQPELRYPHRLYLPSLARVAEARTAALRLPPWLEGWRMPPR